MRVREHATTRVIFGAALGRLFVQPAADALEVARDLAAQCLVQLQQRGAARAVTTNRQQLQLNRSLLQVVSEVRVRIHHDASRVADLERPIRLERADRSVAPCSLVHPLVPHIEEQVLGDLRLHLDTQASCQARWNRKSNKRLLVSAERQETADRHVLRGLVRTGGKY